MSNVRVTVAQNEALKDRYDPKELLEKANIPWGAIESVDAKAIIASRDLYDNWKRQFVNSIKETAGYNKNGSYQEQDSEKLWQSVGPMVDDSLPAGTAQINTDKIQYKTAQEQEKEAPKEAPPPPPEIDIPTDAQLVYDSETKKWKVVKKASHVTEGQLLTRLFEYVENGEEFEEVESEFDSLPDAKAIFAAFKELHDTIGEDLLPYRIVTAQADIPPEMQEYLEKAEIAGAHGAALYSALETLKQIQAKGGALPLTRSLAQNPFAVMMLEHLRDKGFVAKELKGVDEVMPGAQVPVYKLTLKGKQLVEAYGKADRYEKALEQQYHSFFKENKIPGLKPREKEGGEKKRGLDREGVERLKKAIGDALGKQLVGPAKPAETAKSPEATKPAETAKPTEKPTEGAQEMIERLLGLKEEGEGGEKKAIRIAKIIKRDNKWYLYSKDGKKKLGGPYDSREQALKRLRQVEFFKHRKGSIEVPKYEVIFRPHPKFKSKSAWLVTANGSPVMAVDADQAFGESKVSRNEVFERWGYFSSPKYGEDLKAALEAKGVDRVIAEDYGGYATKLPVRKAQVEAYTPYKFATNTYVRHIPTGKIGRVVSSKGEWYCVNYGDIIDYTMAELLEAVSKEELKHGHIKELTSVSERPYEYNVTNQANNRLKDLPEVEKRAQNKGAIEMVDRSGTEAPPITHVQTRTAQVQPTPAGDVKVGVPAGEEPAPTRPTTPDEVTTPSPGLVTPEGEAKLKGTQYPSAAPMSEVILQILASLIAASNEWTTAQALEELKNVFTNQRELDLFQGRLVELVEINKQRSRPALIPRAMSYAYCIRKLHLPEERTQQLIKLAAEQPERSVPRFFYEGSWRSWPDYKLLDYGDRMIEYLREQGEHKEAEELSSVLEAIRKRRAPYEEVHAESPRVGDYVQFAARPGEIAVGKIVGVMFGTADIAVKVKNPDAPGGVETVILPKFPLNAVEVVYSRKGLERHGYFDVIEKLENSVYEPATFEEEKPLTEETVKTLEEQMRGFQERTSQLEESLKKVTQENTELKQVRAQLEQKLNTLCKLPRAKRLAQLMLEYYITDRDQTDELLKLDDRQFLEKEKEVTALCQRLKTKIAQYSPPPALPPIIGALPASVSQSEEKDVGFRSNSKVDLFSNFWSRPGSISDINNE